MSIDHGKVLALALQKVNYVHQSLLANRVVSGSFAVDDETCCRWANALNVAGAQLDRALAQPAEAVEDITDLVMQPGAVCPTCCQTLHVDTDSDDLLQAKAHADEGWRLAHEWMRRAQAAEATHDAAQGAVAWRFWMDESESWLKPGWSEWSADSKFRLLCDSLGYRAEFAYPATHPQAAPAQGGGDEWGSRMRRLARVGPFTAQPGERYIDEDVAVIVLRRALAAAPSQEGE